MSRFGNICKMSGGAGAVSRAKCKKRRKTHPEERKVGWKQMTVIL